MKGATLKCKVDDSIDRFAIDAHTFRQLDLPSISYLQVYRIEINDRVWHGKLAEPVEGKQWGNVLLVSSALAEQFDVSRSSIATISVSNADRVASLKYKLCDNTKTPLPIVEGIEVHPDNICRLDGDTVKIITCDPGAGYITKETRLGNADPSNSHSKSKFRRLGQEFQQENAAGFDRLAGKNDVIEEVRNKVLLPFNNPDLATEHLGSPLNGVLIYGPEGVGKSTVVKATAEETNATILHVPAKGANDPEIVQGIYKKASSQKGKCIISVDPLDTIIPAQDRESTALAILQECLNNSQQNEQVITIAVARKPDQLPHSLLRAGRLEQIIEIPLPNRRQREELFRYFLRDIKAKSVIDYPLLADQTETYKGADIQKLSREAGTGVMIEANTSKGDAEITTEKILDFIKARCFP